MDIALIVGMTAIEDAKARFLANPLPPSPWVVVVDDTIVIRAGYTDVLVRLLRWVAGARWHRPRRCWTVPLTSAEALRSILPEVLRLAELTADGDTTAKAGTSSAPTDAPSLFREAARLMYGADWLGQVAEALGHDQVALARWLAGETDLESGSGMLATIQSLLRRRSAQFLSTADQLEIAIESNKPQ